MNENDTIVAPATALGRSALAVVRIDGPRSSAIARELTSRGDLEERRATLVRLVVDGELLDEAIATRFVAPHSYTGNDLVELSLHGSPLLVERILRACVRLGARIAEPGEFTERAVLNGKLDLVQAEAVADLIDSRTALQARLSLRNLEGSLSRSAEELRASILDVVSRLEGALDFSDEGYEFITRDEARNRLAKAAVSLEELDRTFSRGRATSTGIEAVILGMPNAGKSTLMNFLCGSDRAIVTEIPGTTRDLLRETIEIGGLPVTLIDTAGLRSTNDTVEAIGVSRAREAAKSAELVLYLIDSERGISDEDRAELARHSDAIIVYTKSDRGEAPAGNLAISIPENRGVDELLRLLDGTVRAQYAAPEGSAVVVNERQRDAIREAEASLGAAIESLDAGATEEIVLVDLYGAVNAIGRLTGAISHEEMLESIFSRFCIGK